MMHFDDNIGRWWNISEEGLKKLCLQLIGRLEKIAMKNYIKLHN